MHRPTPNQLATLFALALAALALACGPKAFRGGEGTDRPEMDEEALSVTLDKTDVDYLVSENNSALFGSRFWSNDVESSRKPPVVAISPIQNATSQHLGDQLQALLAALETTLVNSGDVSVVARSRQEQLAKEIGIQQGAIFDPESARRLGRQLGAQYFLTGKITSVDERLSKTRRVQYTLFTQIIDIETGVIKFQNEASRSKALKN